MLPLPLPLPRIAEAAIGSDTAVAVAIASLLFIVLYDYSIINRLYIIADAFINSIELYLVWKMLRLLLVIINMCNRPGHGSPHLDAVDLLILIVMRD